MSQFGKQEYKLNCWHYVCNAVESANRAFNRNFTYELGDKTCVVFADCIDEAAKPVFNYINGYVAASVDTAERILPLVATLEENIRNLRP